MRIWIKVLFCLLFLAADLSAEVIYVSTTTGSDAYDGTSTSTAKNTVNGAIAASSDGDTIKIASGTYEGNWNSSTGSLVFEGGYTTDFQTRDWGLYTSTIIGSISVYADTGLVLDGLSVSKDMATAHVVKISYTTAEPSTVTISNCKIFNSTWSAIRVSVGSAATINLTIASNTIFNCRTGIEMSPSGYGNILISNNVISDMQYFGGTADRAEFYGYGGGIYFLNNGPVITISSNTISGCQGYGITGRPSSAGLTIEKNRITNCGSTGNVHEGGGIRSSYGTAAIAILNNIIVKNTGAGIYLAEETTPNIVKNNTLADNTDAGVLYGLGTTFKNNIIANNSNRGINENVGDCGLHGEIAYNVFGDNLGGPEDFCLNTNYEAGLSFYMPVGHDNLLTMSTSTLFVDPENGDYHLAAGSPAIDMGDPADPVGQEPAPNGGRINCGAYGGTAQAPVSETVPPSAVTDLEASTGDNMGEIKLTWSAPGDDGDSNRNVYGSGYILRYTTFSLSGRTTAQWWSEGHEYDPPAQWIVGEDTSVTKSAGVQFNTGQPMGVVGIRENFVVSGLDPGDTFYFMLKTRDNSGNISAPDTKSTDTVTMANAMTQDTGNNVPVLGHTTSYVLGLAAQRIDGSDLVDIMFRVMDADGAGDTSVLFSSAQYRLADGPWGNLDAGDISFSDSPFVPAVDFSGAEYTLTWDLDETFAAIEHDTVSFRFRVTDGDSESLYASTGTFAIDTSSPPAALAQEILHRSETSVTVGWTQIDTELHFASYTVHFASYSFNPCYPEEANRIWTVLDDPALEIFQTTHTIVTGLSFETTYWFFIKPADTFGHITVCGTTPSTMTMTAPDITSPEAVNDLTVSTDTAASIRLFWNAPNDPTDSPLSGEYRIQRSTWAGVSWSTSGASVDWSTSSVTAGQPQGRIVTGLYPNTTYYFALWTADDDFNWSPVSNISTEATHALAPQNAVFLNVFESSVTAGWDALAPEPSSSSAAGYVLEASSTNFDGSDVPSSSSTANVSMSTLTVTGLVRNTTYFFRAASLNCRDVPNYSVLPATVTPAAKPGPSGTPLSLVSANSVTAKWENGENPSGTLYEANVSLDDFSSVSMTNFTTGLSAAFSPLLPETTYYFRVRAKNHAGKPTDYLTIGSTVTTPVQFTKRTIPVSGGTVELNASSRKVMVEILPHTFNQPVTVTVQLKTSFLQAPSPAAELTGAGIGTEITLDKPVVPGRNAIVTFFYLDSDVAGLDESRLILARHDTGRNVWVPLVSEAVPALNRVTGLTNHFSVFQVMQANPSNTLSAVKAFPNPLRPAQGHTSMTFSNLPANTRIRIYTFSGELVRDMTANNSGIAGWDGMNDAGKKTASGVYFVFIQGAGKKKTLKVAIQR